MAANAARLERRRQSVKDLQLRYSFPILAVLVSATPAYADVPDVDIVKCAAEIDDTARLACYDSLAAGISAEATKVIDDRRAAAAERAAKKAAAEAARAESVFGAEQTGKPDTEGRVDEIRANVVEAYQDRLGKYLLMLDNGQFWKQLEGKLLPVRAGEQVKVERGSLGGYRLTMERQGRTVAAKRIK